VDAAGEVRAFYEQLAEPPAPAPEQTILVVQADGQGGPLVPASPAAPSVRFSKGQTRGKKKEAVVTGLYTIAPYRRTPQEVVAALLQDPGRPEMETRPTR
jgi:1,6-anhydro-N-acetylmuramate kinase